MNMNICRFILLLIVCGTVMCGSTASAAGDDTVPIRLLGTDAERIEPLQDIKMTIEVTNTIGEQMWDPFVQILLPDDISLYFTVPEERTPVLIGGEYLDAGQSATVEITLTAGALCPSQRYGIPVTLYYRRGSCDGGCSPGEIQADVSVTVYRKDPKIAIITVGPEEVTPGTPLIYDVTLNNLGTGPASSVSICAESSPQLQSVSYFESGDSYPSIGVGQSLDAISEIYTDGAEPGYYEITFAICYEDKYGTTLARSTVLEVKLKGTASEEALFQATQLKEMGVNSFQIKEYLTAISYFERAIEIYGRIDNEEEIALCNQYINLSTTYLQAENLYIKGNAYFTSEDYAEAKRFYLLALDIYYPLENSQRIAELTSKIDICNGNIEKYTIMDWTIYASVIFCLMYGIIAKREKIVEALKRG